MVGEDFNVTEYIESFQHGDAWEAAHGNRSKYETREKVDSRVVDAGKLIASAAEKEADGDLAEAESDLNDAIDLLKSTKGTKVLPPPPRCFDSASLHTVQSRTDITYRVTLRAIRRVHYAALGVRVGRCSVGSAALTAQRTICHVTAQVLLSAGYFARGKHWVARGASRPLTARM